MIYNVSLDPRPDKDDKVLMMRGILHEIQFYNEFL